MSVPRRVRRVAITPDLLLALLIDKKELHLRVEAGIPITATLAGSSYDGERREFVLYLEHESFEPITERDRVPTINPTFTGIACRPPATEPVGYDPADVELGGEGGTA